MSLRLEIKVVPVAGKSGCILDKTQRLKCFLKSQAEDGKANKELIKYIAEVCDVPQLAVDIVSGWTSRNKVLLIKTDLTYEQFLTAIGLGKQGKLF